MEHRIGYFVAAVTGALVTAAVYEVSGAFADAAAVFSTAEAADADDAVTDDGRRRTRDGDGLADEDREGKRKDRKQVKRDRRRPARDGVTTDPANASGAERGRSERRARLQKKIREKLRAKMGEENGARADRGDVLADDPLLPPADPQPYPSEVLNEEYIEEMMLDLLMEEDTDYYPDE